METPRKEPETIWGNGTNKPRYKVGDFITREEELLGLPSGEGENSYSVIPEVRTFRGETLAGIAYVNESGEILFWVARNLLRNEAASWVKEHGKEAGWEP